MTTCVNRRHEPPCLVVCENHVPHVFFLGCNCDSHGCIRVICLCSTSATSRTSAILSMNMCRVYIYIHMYQDHIALRKWAVYYILASYDILWVISKFIKVRVKIHVIPPPVTMNTTPRTPSLEVHYVHLFILGSHFLGISEGLVWSGAWEVTGENQSSTEGWVLIQSTCWCVPYIWSACQPWSINMATTVLQPIHNSIKLRCIGLNPLFSTGMIMYTNMGKKACIFLM